MKKQSKSKSSSTAVAQQRADPAALKMAKAWELAYSPAKSLPMNAIMLYMSGSGVQIFSMMAVGMLITGPLKGITTMNSGKYRSLLPCVLVRRLFRHCISQMLILVTPTQLSTDFLRQDKAWYCPNCCSLHVNWRESQWDCTSVGVWDCCQQKQAIGSLGDRQEQ